MAADQADLVAQIRSAQSDLDLVLAQLDADAGSALANGQAQRQLLAQLERSITSGASSAVTTARGEIAAAIAVTSNLVQQSRMTNDQRGSAELASAQARTRAAVEQIGRDIFERRIFNPYLRFASAEEEAVYREREAQRRDYISRELERDTPQSNLNAANATLAQINDAGAHGANRSPEYDAALRDITRARDEQITAMGRDRVRPQEAETAQPPAPANTNLDEIAAVFRAAGVTSNSADSALNGHGLAQVALERGGNTTGRST